MTAPLSDKGREALLHLARQEKPITAGDLGLHFRSIGLIDHRQFSYMRGEEIACGNVLAALRRRGYARKAYGETAFMGADWEITRKGREVVAQLRED